MAYFPASCDYDCEDCSQNKCGWCAFYDRFCGFSTATNPYVCSTTSIISDAKKKEDEK